MPTPVLASILGPGKLAMDLTMPVVGCTYRIGGGDEVKDLLGWLKK